VEVYDRELGLVKRTLTFQTVSVEPGAYFAIAHLPDGSHLRQSIDVTDEPYVRVPLEGGTSTTTNHEHARWRDIEMDGAYLDVEIEKRPVPSSAIPVVGYVREPNGAWNDVRIDTTRTSLSGDLVVPEGLDAIAAIRPDGLQTMVRFPRGRTRYFRVVIGRAPDSHDVDLVVRVAHPTAAALLDYLNHDRIRDTELITTAPELAADLLLYKLRDPVAAAAGAFALLRLDALERLHNWTQNLANWFEWLPDGLVARAEHLARLGDHASAAKLLAGLRARGLPVLSVGLTYATDRLRTYSAYWPDNTQLRDSLEEITRYAMATDFSAPVTTFIGHRPDAPVPLERAHHFRLPWDLE
jgi:hypothetical protein